MPPSRASTGGRYSRIVGVTSWYQSHPRLRSPLLDRIADVVVFRYEQCCSLYVAPTMRLYLPRVEARLRGITALWFCRKKGHLHTIPCNEQEWDKELAYNRHFTQYINIALHHPDTIKVRLRNQNKRRPPLMLQIPDHPN